MGLFNTIFWDWFFGVFLNGFCVSIVLPAVLVFLALVLANRIGSSFGLPHLIWVESPSGGPSLWRQFLIGGAIGVFFWQVLLAGYLSEEFASNYTGDHPPFCEVRAPFEPGSIQDGSFPGRFRYWPSDVVTVWRYFAIVVGSFVVCGAIVLAINHRFSTRTRSRTVPAPEPFDASGRSAVQNGVGTGPARSVLLPLGTVAGLALMTAVAWVAFLPSVEERLSKPVGQCMVFLGGWGKQAGRQASVKKAVDYYSQQRKRLADLVPAADAAGDVQSLQTLEMARAAAASDHENEEKSTKEWLYPYAPVYGLFLLTFAVVWLVTIGLGAVYREWHLLTPAGWVLFYLHALVFGDILFSFFFPVGTQGALLALCGLAILAGRAYKVRFPALEEIETPVVLQRRYKELIRARAEGTPLNGPKPPAIETPDLCNIRTVGGQQIKPPIAVVCASGGGSRAALWTMKVLTLLEETFEGSLLEETFEGSDGTSGPVAFPYHIRLVTGASGGMLAAAAYVANLREPSNQAGPKGPLPHGVNRLLGRDQLVDACTHNFLDDPVTRLGTHDLLHMFLPFRLRRDRGCVIEEAWRVAFQGVLDQTFADLHPGELAMWRPSIILSPMLVEDGRELFISNLDLWDVTNNRAPMLSTTPPNSTPTATEGRDADVLSREGIEFFNLFPEEKTKFHLGTAVRMSASFPYVLPPATLPTSPPRRVVDAGYYDNYGVGIAASWLANNLEWVKKQTSGVVFIQIRDGASLDSRRRAVVTDTFPSLIERGLQWATTPPEGLWQSRQSAQVFRNDNLLHVLAQLMEAHHFPPNFFTTTAFELKGGDNISLSFNLTSRECRRIRDACDSPEVRSQALAVKGWWHDRLRSPDVSVSR